MVEDSTKGLPELKLFSMLTKNVFGTFIIGLIGILLVWYAQYHWSRRKMYQIAAQRKGPFCLPFLGCVSVFLRFGNYNILKSFQRLATQYESPVPMWVAQQLCYGVWTPHEMEAILTSQAALEKEDSYKIFDPVVGGGIFSSPVPRWKRHRKILSQTFNQKILDGYVEVFLNQSNIFIEKLKAEAGKGISDISSRLSHYSMDVICETAMGVTVNSQTTESDFHNWVTKAMDSAVTQVYNILYRIDFIFNLTTISKEARVALAKMNSFTNGIIAQKKEAYQKKLAEGQDQPEVLLEEEPQKKNSFLQQLIILAEEGAHFTNDDMLTEVNTFIVGGSDTTTIVNGFNLIMLGMHQDIQDKVYEEVMDVVGPDRPVETSDLGKLKYLERVLKETMRLFPPVPIIGRSISADIETEHSTLPAGSSVALVLVLLHRNPKYWPEPLKFDPDRFLPEEIAKRHPYSWLPFSGGPRNCIGLKFGMMSLKTFAATVIRKYRFFTDYKSVEDIELSAPLKLTPLRGFRVSMELRE